MEIRLELRGLFPHQREFLACKRRYAIVCSGTKAGKAQSLDATVYTPIGPTRLGEIVVGDEIATPSGFSMVVGVYPRGERQLFNVTFSDGSTVEADGEHLWGTEHPRRGYRVCDTNELRAEMGQDYSGFMRTRVPASSPVEFRRRDVPLDGYLIGVLIGDGCLTDRRYVRFASADPEIAVAVRKRLPGGLRVIRDGLSFSYRIEDTLHEPSRLVSDLDVLGLIGKHTHEMRVPREYLVNTIAIRESVLSGLLDTDGFMDKDGQPEIAQPSAALARDIGWLVESLGGHVLTSIRDTAGRKEKSGEKDAPQRIYRQRIVLGHAGRLFRLERKRVAARPSVETGQRTLRDVKSSRVTAAVCIELADSRGLYLTDHFVPTHNSAAAAYYGAYQLISRPGITGTWIAPSYSQANIGYEAIGSLLPQEYTECRKVVGIPTITINGSTIEFKSSDTPDNLYGQGRHFAIIDEASRISEEAFNAVRSTLTFTRGPVRMLSNPGPRQGWFYRLYVRGLDKHEPYVQSFKWKTTDNPMIPREEIEDAKRTLSEETFRSLYEGEFLDIGGAVFRNIRECAVGALRGWTPEGTYVGGMDVARVHDYNAIVIIEKASRDVVYMDRWHGVSWETTVSRALAVQGMYPGIRFNLDWTGMGDPVLEMLARAGVRVTGIRLGAQTKAQLVEHLSALTERKMIKYPADEVLIGELESYEGERNPSGLVSYAGARGTHDDFVIALCLAAREIPVSGVSTNWDEMERLATEVSDDPAMSLGGFGSF